jgi:valyl-tRNA synthetase
MDTWMDSSITPLHLRGWPDDLDLDEFEPTALRPQGHDIIRTWAFYTLLRVGSMADEKPWDDVLINGMVFGSDGNKMSKSRGNFVTPEEGIEEFGADAIREALVLGGQPGSDVQYQPKEATSAARFHTKIWNITRFATEHLVTDMPTREDPAYRDADTWILSRCSQVADAVAGHMDEYRYDAALRELREFVWHDLADDYLELIKGRLYDGRPGERNAARQALATALSASLRMLSPFAPFLTAEAWAALPTTEGSVHESDWPALDMADETAELAGSLIADVASTIRGWKSDRGMALNAPLDKVEVYPDRTPDRAVDTYDLSEAVNAPVMVREGVPTVELVPVEVEPDHSTIGPEFRDQADEVVAALEAMDPAAVQSQKQVDDEIEVDLGGDGESRSASERSSGGTPREVAVVPGDAVSITEEHRAESGEEVAVLEGDNGTILVYP